MNIEIIKIDFKQTGKTQRRMSLFLSSYNNLTQGTIDEEKINLAEIQFDAMCKTFNNILKSCLEKCVSHDQYSEGDLSKGEMCCIDRCVNKIHYSNRLIGGFLHTKGVTPENILPQISADVPNNIKIPDSLPKTFDYQESTINHCQ